MKASMQAVLQQAQAGAYAVPAANYIDWASAQAYVSASEALGVPLILAFAQVHQDWLSLDEAATIGRYFQETVRVPVVLHLDHGQDAAFIERAMDLGFNSVMIDASQDAFADNVRKTRHIVRLAHAQGIAVEAEIGFVGANGDAEGIGEQASIYTEVADAVAFVAETQVDSLAVSIGTSHGLYKGTPRLNFERLAQLRAAVTVPLVLHGGSSSGDENLKRCAQSGIAKINLFSDLMVGGYGAREAASVHDYPSLQTSLRQGMATVLRHYYHVFGTQALKEGN